jgi:hypothetical protein
MAWPKLAPFKPALRAPPTKPPTAPAAIGPIKGVKTMVVATCTKALTRLLKNFLKDQCPEGSIRLTGSFNEYE